MVKKNWSINVTTRNPARLKDILKVLREFEGLEFDEKIQEQFIERVVKKKLYSLTAPIRDKSLRGRTWAGIFNMLGFAIAIKRYGKVKILPAGRDLIKENADEEKIFLKQLLKWQLKNPSITARGYRDYNLRPFIVTLHILKKTGGLSKREFNLFIPTVRNFKDTEKVVKEIKELRKKIDSLSSNREKEEFFHQYSRKKVASIYNVGSNEEEIDKKLRNLKDYGDTIIRYFRYTGLTSLSYQKVKLSDRRKIELDTILKNFDGSILSFKGKNQNEILKKYYDYFGSNIKPELPFEELMPQIEIIKNLINDINKLKQKIDSYRLKLKISIPLLKIESLKRADISKRNLLIKELRKIKSNYLLAIERYEIKKADKLREIISVLRKVREGDSSIPSPKIYLEWYTCLALESINDDEIIIPNYPKDENNEPTSNAIPNKPDIEAHYTDFVIVTEVTLKRDSKQWIDEGMPVPRHVIEIKSKIKNKYIIGLFIAPSIHYDTRNQFFIVSKYGLEGGKVPIIPITLDQFIEMLEIMLKIKIKRETKKEDIKNLLEKLIKAIKDSSDAKEWIDKFPTLINKWKKQN